MSALGKEIAEAVMEVFHLGYGEQSRIAAADAAIAPLVEALELAVVYLSEVPHKPAIKIALALARAKGYT